jgi:hypothetical protein
MILITSYGSLQSMISKLFLDLGLKNLGEVSLLTVYFCFAFFALFSSFINSKYSVRVVLTAASSCYCLFNIAGFIVSLEF